MKRLPLSLALLAALALAACGAEPAAERPAAATPEAEWAALVPKGNAPFPGVVTAGQPSFEQLEALAAAGFSTVINLRRPGERGTAGEAERVAELGMRYVQIPVAGPEGLTEANARALAAALEEAPPPVLVHCGSSNRVGALFALKAYWLEGASADEALATGRAAGLTRLEPAVREILEAADGGA